jgi:arylformamidase
VAVTQTLEPDLAQTTYDPAWLDLQYNNRARIVEHPQIFERWAARSAQARSELSCRQDVRYGDGPGETLDIFPTTTQDAPVLVFIHGGWWRALDKADFSFVAPLFVRGGAMVVLPNYALCPAVTVEHITLQMVRALAWVWRHAALYGGNPRRIVLVGHSAGGHLATMLLSCAWRDWAGDLPANLVRSALSVSGVYDLAPVQQTPFLQADLRLTAQSARRLSPALFPAPRSRRLVACAGALESEEFLRQNQRIRDAWGAATVRVCETVPGRNHLDVVDGLAESGSRLYALAWELLDAA